MDFGQGKARTAASTVSATISAAGRPGRSMTRDEDVALLVGAGLELVAGEAGRAEEAFDGLRGGVGARALALLAEVGRAFGEAGEGERQPAGVAKAAAWA